LKKRRIGILTFSDGRKDVYESLLAMNQQFQAALKKRLEGTGEFEAVTGEIIGDTDVAGSEAKKLAEAGVEATVFNFVVWAFPNFPVIAANFTPGSYLLFSNVNPQYPRAGRDARHGGGAGPTEHTQRPCLGRHW
jgi:L-fucose/D-arabinose isomerase